MIIVFTKDWSYKNRHCKRGDVLDMITFVAVSAINDGCAIAAPKGMSEEDARKADLLNDDDANDDLGDAKPPLGYKLPWKK